MIVRKAVIPAAGLGTRFLPLTKSMPKEMLPIINIPAIHYAVDEAIQAGIDDILIITARGKRSIEDYFDDAPELEARLEQNGKSQLLKIVKDASTLADIHYIRQKEPLGLGDAILRSKRHVNNEPFAVLLGDDIVRSNTPCISQLMNIFEDLRTSIIAVEEVPDNMVSSYGIIRGKWMNERTIKIDHVVEKPQLKDAPSRIGAIGRYVFTPEIFKSIESVKPGVGNEIQLADAINFLIQKQDVMAYRFEGTRYDTGNVLGYLHTLIDFAMDHDEIKKDLLSYFNEILSKFPEIGGRNE